MSCYGTCSFNLLLPDTIKFPHTGQAKGDPSLPEELHTAHVLSSLNGDAGNHDVLLPLGFATKTEKTQKHAVLLFVLFVISSFLMVISFCYL
jgi:hypothetical protein